MLELELELELELDLDLDLRWIWSWRKVAECTPVPGTYHVQLQHSTITAITILAYHLKIITRSRLYVRPYPP